jgi:hypothetical protein
LMVLELVACARNAVAFEPTALMIAPSTALKRVAVASTTGAVASTAGAVSGGNDSDGGGGGGGGGAGMVCEPSSGNVAGSGFYVPLPHSDLAARGVRIVCARPAEGGAVGSFALSSPCGTRLPPLSSVTLLSECTPISADEAAPLWKYGAVAAITGTKQPSVCMLCGPVLQCLPHVRRLLGGRPNVRRATLLTGHVAVGIVLSSSQVKALREALLQERTSPPPMTPPDTTPPERAWSDGAWMDSSGIEASDAPQAWTKSVAEALEQQTRLQLALPPPPPDADDWQPCWADLTHEATALDETELEERQERQQRTSDFQLELMQRRKREQASKREQARADAAPPVPDTAPPMAAPAPPAPLPTDTLVAGAPEVGMARNSRPMPMLPGGRRGPTPAVPPRRVSAEAQRAAAQSKLHPLLQLASMDPADSIATAPSGEPQ